jgi:hypothetical protein
VASQTTNGGPQALDLGPGTGQTGTAPAHWPRHQGPTRPTPSSHPRTGRTDARPGRP